MLILAVTGLFLDFNYLAPIFFLLSLSWIFALSKQYLSNFPGIANMVTFSRACFLVFVLFFMTNPWWLGLTYLVIVLMDILDGYLARKYNESTVFGTYLDMETDAFATYAMTCSLYFLDLVTWWMFIPALMRYVFGTIILTMGVNHKAEPKRKYASIIAGVYFGVLIGSFIIHGNFAFVCQLLIAVAIIFSFARSFYFQFSK